MTSDEDVIAALQECLKYERTLWDCYAQAYHYMGRWRIHRLEDWFLMQRSLTEKRLDCLMRRICILDTKPGNERYAVEPGKLDKASDIVTFDEYFSILLYEAKAAYTEGVVACGIAEDSVSCGLLGSNKCEIEDALQRIEAKLNKVRLIGPEMYLAQHLHSGPM